MTDNTPALADLASQINAEHKACHFAMRESIKHAVRAGELLIEAKVGLPHGEWAGWIDAHCEFSDRTARAYMRIAKELPKLDEEKRQRVADLPLREALVSIADPVAKDRKADAAEIRALTKQLARNIGETVNLLERQRRMFVDMGRSDLFDHWVKCECPCFFDVNNPVVWLMGLPTDAEALICNLNKLRCEYMGEGRADRINA